MEFAIDEIVPSQWFDRGRSEGPNVEIKRLMVAMLEDALQGALGIARAPSVHDHGSSFKKHLLDRSIVISRRHKAAQQKAYAHDEDYQVTYQLRSWWEPPDDVVGDKGQNPV